MMASHACVWQQKTRLSFECFLLFICLFAYPFVCESEFDFGITQMKTKTKNSKRPKRMNEERERNKTLFLATMLRSMFLPAKGGFVAEAKEVGGGRLGVR